MRCRLACGVAAIALAAVTVPAAASGDGPSSNWALNEYGGTAAERQRLYSGDPGILMGTSPASLLFVGWRRLHGQAVGNAAGEALASPCCGGSSIEVPDAVRQWMAMRATVPGAATLPAYLDVERSGPDYMRVPNCLNDAFRNAAGTLKERSQAHDPASPEIHSWLEAQDAVFTACSKPVASLPPLPGDAPAWLRSDHEYQAAALAFYNADFPAAAQAFASIAQDNASPWHDMAPYLRVRALLRKALASNEQPDFAAAQDAAQAIDPSSTLHAAAMRLAGMAELHADPASAGARLAATLAAPALTAEAGSAFKDIQTLDAIAAPEALDWIYTLKTGAAAPLVPLDESLARLPRAKAADARRVAALAHARERYGVTHDPAWMLAALALMQPDEATDAVFMAAAAAVDPAAPAYLTALYHRVRLTIGETADPAAIRTLLDTALARTDLATTARNLLLAERLQVAVDLPEFARFMLRHRQCTVQSDGCIGSGMGFGAQGPGLFDGASDDAAVGIGDDARYLIDRMSLATRIALSRERTLPAVIRMDLALTNFARAVLLHDDGAADAVSGPLQALLPAMAAEFAAIPRAAPGTDKLFAEYFVLAKIPGLRADLLDYTRPAGAVADFEGGWPNWVVLARPDPAAVPPASGLYDNAGIQLLDVPAGTDLGSGRRVPDAVCDGMCGAGGFVPHLPAFLAGTAAKASEERRFLPPPGRYGDAGAPSILRSAAFPDPAEQPFKTLAPPPGASFVWEFVLDYATRHPSDPRVPEALHWLIHVGHYGQSHDHCGKRAFALLKSRYPNSPWAKQNQYYYD